MAAPPIRTTSSLYLDTVEHLRRAVGCLHRANLQHAHQDVQDARVVEAAVSNLKRTVEDMHRDEAAMEQAICESTHEKRKFENKMRMRTLRARRLQQLQQFELAELAIEDGPVGDGPLAIEAGPVGDGPLAIEDGPVGDGPHVAAPPPIAEKDKAWEEVDDEWGTETLRMGGA